MIGKLKHFFESSIRNKLMVVLPSVLAFVILLFFTLSALTLRKSVHDHVIAESKNRFELIANSLDVIDEDFRQRELLFRGVAYAQTFDGEGTLHFQRGTFSDYRLQRRNTNKIYERNPEGLSVLDVAIEGQRFLELEQWVKKRKLVVGFPLAPAQHLLLVQTLTLLGIALVTIIASFVVVASMGHIISGPVCQLAEEANSMACDDASIKPLSLADRKDEVGKLAVELNNLFKKVRDQQAELTVQRAEAAKVTIATQVAHDIRSPLSSIQTAMGFLGGMQVGQDKRFVDALNLLQLGAKRLTGIADDLLAKHVGKPKPAATFSLFHILDELAGEFHSQHPQIRFVKAYPSKAVELTGDGAKLQRAFSNVVKNASEAMEYKGAITLRAELKDNNVIVAIADTGPGMAPEKLEKVLAGGYTEGKEDGHGIGTQVVRQTVEEFKGELTAESELGRGTTFFITMPLAQDQTQATIQVEENRPVIIIDDDPSLREQWRLVLEQSGKQVLLCESYEDFVTQKLTPDISHTVIVDYHFDNSEKTGADILPILKQQGFANLYLCTAEYWKPSVQKLAEELQATLCPKPLPKISVIANPEGVKQSPTEANGDCHVAAAPRNDKVKGYTVLVIDDDLGIRMSWDFSREKLGIAALHCYENMEAMQANGIDFKTIDLAFVDKNIEKSAFTGADVLSFLKSRCPGKIILASGESEESLRNDPQFAEADFIIRDKIPASLKVFLAGSLGPA